MVSNEQINSLSARVAKLEESIDIEQRRIDLQNEQERTEEPNFWDNPDEARKQLKKVADLAAKYSCAVVIVGHMNKASSEKNLYRGLGSIDITAIAIA